MIARFGTLERAPSGQAGLDAAPIRDAGGASACLRELGETIGRVPTAKDIDEHRGLVPSKSLYWHTFGSLSNALREAGFDVPVGEERLERAIDQGVGVCATARPPAAVRRLEARRGRKTASLLTEWQVYRMFEARRGAWSTFQFLVRERLLGDGRRGCGRRLDPRIRLTRTGAPCR